MQPPHLRSAHMLMQYRINGTEHPALSSLRSEGKLKYCNDNHGAAMTP